MPQTPASLLRRTCTAAATLLALAASGGASAVPLVGVVGPDQLVAFDSANPTFVTATLTVTGLGGQVIRGIDFRPSNGVLYAIGQSGTLFTIDTATGAATIAGSVPVTSADLDIGFAFNPVPDAIRTVTATDRNLRTLVATTGATVEDTALAYAAGDRNAGTNPNVTGAAYTNQVAGTVTATTLYGIDAATSSLVIQNPPNAGVLNTVGALGVTLFSNGFGIGFDIDGASGLAFASLVTSTGANGLYGVDLATGAATLLGGFGANTVRDIAVGSFAVTPIPEPETYALFALGLAGLAAAGRRRRQRAA
jgi:hypothetical protein